MTFGVIARLATGFVLCLFATGCERSITSIGVDQSIQPLASRGHSADSPAADTVAKAIAIALGDDGVRALLRDHLRDSPFKDHALHMRSFLRTADGQFLAVASARALGRTPEEFLELELSLPPLELVMPRRLDRTRSQLARDVVVVGTTQRLGQNLPRGLAKTGFRTDGTPISVELVGRAPFVYLALRPITSNFGGDPEARRKTARKRLGSTISTREEELLAMTIPIVEPDSGSEPPPEEPVNPPPATPAPINDGRAGQNLPPFMSWNYCTMVEGYGEDHDEDGIVDECEGAFFKHFFPHLKLSLLDRAPGREPYFSAAKVYGATGRIQLIFALSYYYDPGDPVFSYKSHDGDSEFVIVEIQPLSCITWGCSWGVEYVTFSAHWHAGAADKSRRVHWTQLEWALSEHGMRRVGGRPIVYVAQDKHANYPSKQSCQTGGYLAWDRCDDAGYDEFYDDPYFPWVIGVSSGPPGTGMSALDISAAYNLGNSFHTYYPSYSSILRDCTTSRANRGGTECYWSNDQFFAGWVPNPESAGDKAGPYSDVFWWFWF